jgi:hypothetical protein
MSWLLPLKFRLQFHFELDEIDQVPAREFPCAVFLPMQPERLRRMLELLPKEEANGEAFSDSKSAFRNEQDENNENSGITALTP